MPHDDVHARVTGLEREVMDLLVTGSSMKQVANRLKVSLPTCSKHRTRVLEKLDVDNDVQLVRRVHSWQFPQSEGVAVENEP